jgi:peptide/nickel transport system substrate-binding protein
MSVQRLSAAIGLVAAILVTACSPTPSPSPGGAVPEQPRAPKRVVAAMRGVPLSLFDPLTSSGGGQQPGSAEMSGLANVGLTVEDDTGGRRPVLVESTPTVENGLWKVSPDGRMETIFKLRDNARWHDGRPVTGDDIAFTLRVDRDPDMAWRKDVAYGFMDSVSVVDALTASITWKQPYIRADWILPALLPKHILEDTYTRDKGAFLQIPYWNTEFIGDGPFRLKEWVHDSHAVLLANDGYMFGRPKLDEVEVKFLPDLNAMLTNLLAGSVQLTLGNNASIEQGLQVKDQFESQGRIVPGFSGWINLNPQFLNPNPAILQNVEFRRALYRSLDRKALAELLAYGYSDPAESSIQPTFLEYKSIEPQIVHYQYDVRGAQQTIESLGYSKGNDGMYRDAANQPLSIEVMATADDTNSKAAFAVLEYFRQAGVTPAPEIVPNQRARDLEYRANFRSFALQSGQGYGPDGVRALLSTDARVAERNYVGGNYVRYMNPEVDVLIEKYFTTIGFNDRMQVLGQLVHHTTENLIWMPLYWRVIPTFIGNRLIDVPAVSDVGAQYWNAHLWDLKA